MKVFDVRLTDNEITATIVGNVYKYVEFYPLVKPVVIGTLERIQSGDPQAIETLRRAINVFLSQGLRQLLPDAQPAPGSAPQPGLTAPPAPRAPLAPPAPRPEALPSP